MSTSEKKPAQPPDTAALLRKISIPVPCPESWEEMTGDDRVRACARCQKNVYNLSAMRASDAAAFLLGVSEPVCLRFYRRADGTMLTSDCRPSWADAKEAARQLVIRKVPALASWRRSAPTVLGVTVALGGAAAAFFVAIGIFSANLRALMAASGNEVEVAPAASVTTKRLPPRTTMGAFGSLGTN
jgi:hypothetical protein